MSIPILYPFRCLTEHKIKLYYKLGCSIQIQRGNDDEGKRLLIGCLDMVTSDIRWGCDTEDLPSLSPFRFIACPVRRLSGTWNWGNKQLPFLLVFSQGRALESSTAEDKTSRYDSLSLFNFGSLFISLFFFFFWGGWELRWGFLFLVLPFLGFDQEMILFVWLDLFESCVGEDSITSLACKKGFGSPSLPWICPNWWNWLD